MLTSVIFRGGPLDGIKDERPDVGLGGYYTGLVSEPTQECTYRYHVTGRTMALGSPVLLATYAGVMLDDETV